MRRIQRKYLLLTFLRAQRSCRGESANVHVYLASLFWPYLNNCSLSLSFAAGLGPGLPAGLGSLHLQPPQCHAHARQLALTLAEGEAGPRCRFRWPPSHKPALITVFSEDGGMFQNFGFNTMKLPKSWCVTRDYCVFCRDEWSLLLVIGQVFIAVWLNNQLEILQCCVCVFLNQLNGVFFGHLCAQIEQLVCVWLPCEIMFLAEFWWRSIDLMGLENICCMEVFVFIFISLFFFIALEA